jgi:hypothetical protein
VLLREAVPFPNIMDMATADEITNSCASGRFCDGESAEEFPCEDVAKSHNQVTP